jgi:cell division protein FtsI/penicillin-binding protein 2
MNIFLLKTHALDIGYIRRLNRYNRYKKMIWALKRKKFNKKNNNRANFVLAIIFLFNLFIVLKLFSLQIINGSYFAEASNNQHQIFQELIPERGKIYLEDKDSGDMYPVATNRQLAKVFAEPRVIDKPELLAEKLIEILEPLWVIEFEEIQKDKYNKEEDVEEAVVDEVEEEGALTIDDFLDEKKKILLEKLSKRKDPYEVIAKKVSLDDLDKIRDLEERGIGYVREYFRYYPEAEIFSNISGFVGYFGDEQRGQYGVEGYFDELLRGERGSLLSNKDAFGYIIMTKGSEMSPAENGFDLVLTIDRSIQFKVCEELKNSVESHDADGGMVVVMDPNTGAIIAMCNYPSYDANFYNKEKDLSLFTNPLISNQFEPGSIFKAVTIAAGLDEGKISPNTTYYDEGCVKVGVETLCNSDLKAHQTQNMTYVLEESLNTGTIFVLNQIGEDSFKKYVKSFGFGDQTGIELSPESSGNIDSLDINRRIYSATASFGQGISVTPIQMVNSFATIANGGKLMKPYLVDKIIKSDGSVEETRPKEVRQVISKKTSLLLSGMLASTVEKGHGKRAGVPGYYIAGKTGTAQVPKEEGGGYEEDKTIGSFAGFGPVENPRFAMLVRIDNPKDVMWAESSAAPLFGRIAKFILNYYEIKPSY